MPQQQDDQSQEQNEFVPEEVKSTHHDWPAYVTFINRTSHPVDVVWRNYTGKHVCYKRRMAPGENYHMNTYVTHPWQAWYSEFPDDVLIDGGDIYMPKAWRGEQNRTKIYIDRPMHSLMELCLHTVRLLVSPDHVNMLEIPQDLHRALKWARTTEVLPHRPHRS